ncbi:MAG: aspartate kinase [Bacteroidales bacterium]|nr:aspartate kinase [Bacteroidales bacterium]
MSNKIVVKFGGSNLKDSQDYSRLAGIVKSYNQPLVIVVSAYFGLTNRIIAALEKAPENRQAIEIFIDDLYKLKATLVKENIHSETQRKNALSELNERIDKLHQLLKSIHFIGEIPDFLYDQVLSVGEKLNSLLISSILKDRDFDCEEALPEDIGLYTDGLFGLSSTNFEKSAEVVKENLKNDSIYVVPGFYGISDEGKITLFGRGGSDYTAASIARCIGAQSVDVWKDVRGFLSADPKIVENTNPIKLLSYDEAAELAYFGARILHPETVSPIKPLKIPLRIMDVENFEDEIIPATVINGHTKQHAEIIKSITYSDDFGILRLHGAGVGARPGILAEATHRLEEEKVNIKSVITSQTSINILLSKTDLEKAFRSMTKSPLKSVNKISRKEDISVIAAVGDGLYHEPGVMAKILGAIASKNINLQTIVMGASAVSAYLIVAQDDRNAAVRTIHESLFEKKEAVGSL